MEYFSLPFQLLVVVSSHLQNLDANFFFISDDPRKLLFELLDAIFALLVAIVDDFGDAVLDLMAHLAVEDAVTFESLLHCEVEVIFGVCLDQARKHRVRLGIDLCHAFAQFLEWQVN